MIDVNDEDARMKKKIYNKKYHKKYYLLHRKEMLRKNKKYHREHKELDNRRKKKYYRLHKEYCQAYGKEYRRLHLEEIHAKDKLRSMKNKERNNERSRNHYYANREQYLTRTKNYRCELRLEALMIVGNGVIQCSNCDCKDLDLIDINHKDGGGGEEVRRTGMTGIKLYKAIITGRRKTDDLNLLCKACNWIHYLKLKYGVIYNIKFVSRKP